MFPFWEEVLGVLVLAAAVYGVVKGKKHWHVISIVVLLAALAWLAYGLWSRYLGKGKKLPKLGGSGQSAQGG